MSDTTRLSQSTIDHLLEAGHICARMPSLDDHLPYRNFGDMWQRQTAEHADRIWMRYYPCAANDESPVEYTFGQFAERIDRVANLLYHTYGIRAGGSLATISINHPHTTAIYFAAWRLGARVVPINPGETDDRAEYIFTNSESTLLIAHRNCRDNYGPIENSLPDTTRKVMILGDSADGPPEGWDHFESMLDAVDASQDLPPIDSVDDSAETLVVYTSGTTGHPKGVVLTQKQMFADALAISKWHAIDEHTVMMNVLPIHHVNGIVVTLLTPVFVGAEIVVNQRFRPRGFWKKLETHNVGIVSVVPTLLQFLIEANEELDLETIPNFRHFICGAGPLSVELARDFQTRFGLRILHGYGLSETVCYSCFLPIELEWHEHCTWMYEFGFPSIGCPIDVNDMAIHDAEGHDVPDGERGEIVIRGHNIMKGYFNNPDANATAFAHGWFRSGDEGFKRRGDDGKDYFFITGRLKELIIRGGINLSPFEIDEVLCAMPGVRVGLAVGFENRYYGEEVGAYVQVESGKSINEADVIAWCKEKLTAAKCPKVVLFGDDIPVTSTGKYQRGKLKHLFEPYKDKQYR